MAMMEEGYEEATLGLRREEQRRGGFGSDKSLKSDRLKS